MYQSVCSLEFSSLSNHVDHFQMSCRQQGFVLPLKVLAEEPRQQIKPTIGCLQVPQVDKQLGEQNFKTDLKDSLLKDEYCHWKFVIHYVTLAPILPLFEVSMSFPTCMTLSCETQDLLMWSYFGPH